MRAAPISSAVTAKDIDSNPSSASTKETSFVGMLKQGRKRSQRMRFAPCERRRHGGYIQSRNQQLDEKYGCGDQSRDQGSHAVDAAEKQRYEQYQKIANTGLKDYKEWHDMLTDSYKVWDDAMQDYYKAWNRLYEDAYGLFNDVVSDGYDVVS